MHEICFLSVSEYGDSVTFCNALQIVIDRVRHCCDIRCMQNYTKLFHKILASSIWDEDDKTRIVWISMLASTDEMGIVRATPKYLARVARVDLESTLTALETFLAPDPDSLTADFDGRRIEVVEGGWRLLNHGKYRDLMSAEQVREYNRVRQAEYRKRRKDVRIKAKQSGAGEALNEGLADAKAI